MSHFTLKRNCHLNPLNETDNKNKYLLLRFSINLWDLTPIVALIKTTRNRDALANDY